MLGNEFRRPIAVDTHPKNDVAMGAARAGALQDAGIVLTAPSRRRAPASASAAVGSARSRRRQWSARAPVPTTTPEPIAQPEPAPPPSGPTGPREDLTPLVASTAPGSGIRIAARSTRCVRRRNGQYRKHIRFGGPARLGRPNRVGRPIRPGRQHRFRVPRRGTRDERGWR